MLLLLKKDAPAVLSMQGEYGFTVFPVTAMSRLSHSSSEAQNL